ncbi:unknown [Bacteroides sp. CAG:702]|nr:unknown [Bacteroides sp. CAG:702]
MRRDEFLYSYCAIQSRAQIRLEQSEKYNSAKIFAVLENKESFLLYCAERGTVDKGCFEEDDNGIFVFSKTAGKREEHFIPYAAIQRISAEITD